jgi:hypothetical protein
VVGDGDGDGRSDPMKGPVGHTGRNGQDYLAGETRPEGLDERTCEEGEIDGGLCHVFVPFGGWLP